MFLDGQLYYRKTENLFAQYIVLSCPAEKYSHFNPLRVGCDLFSKLAVTSAVFFLVSKVIVDCN